MLMKGFQVALLILLSSAAAFSQTQILAVVNGEAITLEQISEDLGSQLSQLERQVYDLKRERLDAIIAERLIGREAAKRGTTLSALVDAEVTSKVRLITETEIDKFYEENKATFQGAPQNSAREQIRSYLQGQKIAEARDAFIEKLKAGADVVMHLTPPVTPKVDISTEGSPVTGGAEAPITIVEFSDFHCPYCKQSQSTIAQLRARYSDKVKVVFKNLPLDSLHPTSRKAHEAGQCALEQGKFWEYHDKLWSSEPDGAPAKLKQLATATGLEMAAFESCLDGGKFKEQIQKDVDEAGRVGANFTPVFFINGQMLSGAQPIESFVRMIEDELKRIASEGRK